MLSKRFKLRKTYIDSLSIHPIIFSHEFVEAGLALALFEASQKYEDDTPNEHHHHLHSEHVIAIRARKPRTVSSSVVAPTKSQESNVLYLKWFLKSSERLKVVPGITIDLIPSQLLRKYVGYVRQYVYPRLSTEAAQILQDFYLELQKWSQLLNSSPITTGHLESHSFKRGTSKVGMDSENNGRKC